MQHNMHEFQKQPDSPSLRVSPIEHDSDIDDFFSSMAVALTSGNVEAIKRLWAIPSFVIGEEMSMAVNFPEEVEKFFSGVKEEYNRRGIFDTRPDIKRVQWVSDSVVFVEVRWPQLGKKGEELGEEASTYTLKKDDNGAFRIHVAVMHGERALSH
jgi:hypothetical protein